MLQVTLVADEHDDNVGIGMVAQLLQPSCDVDICSVFGDVVDEKGTNSASVIAVVIMSDNGDAIRTARLTQM